MSNQLRGKCAIVTGAGRGIGKAIAEAYGHAGASVGCLARTRAEVDETAAAIERQGHRALAVSVDVRDAVAIDRAFTQVAETFGGLDIIVINAGINAARGPVTETDPRAWAETVETNLVGAYHCARAAIPHLRRLGAGKIITVGSGLGHRGVPARSAYACSKAGLWMLTRVLAQEVAPFNISVNELIPGPVNTALTQRDAARGPVVSLGDSEWVKSPADVVPLALFLAGQPDVGPTAQSFSLMRRDG